MQRIGAAFSGLPDFRGKSNNQRYAIEDAALSAFSIFFTQSPSFLDSQVRMQKQQGKNNAASLFGVHQIPSDNQIRNLLDPVPPETLFPLMATISDELYRDGYLDSFRSINGTFLVALDGTDFFSSEKISCPGCTQSKLKNGKTLNRHIAVTPVLVAPGQKNVIALAPQFVQPQDGHDKQDCELAASGRWLDQWGAHYAPWGSLRATVRGVPETAIQAKSARAANRLAYNLYVAALAGSNTILTWYQLDATHQWSALQWPMAQYLSGVSLGSALDSVLVEILDGVDVSNLVGSHIYVGYGLDAEEMVTAGRYREVMTISSRPTQ
jgi:hypothetical protein